MDFLPRGIERFRKRMVSSELIVVITGAWVVSTPIYNWLRGEILLLRSTQPSPKPQPLYL